ncbi:MAG TPA: Maf family protein [Desulfobacterales bacterium]
MMQVNPEPQIILASKSPRRKYLLEKAGLSIAVIPSRFDESSVAMSAPNAYVKTLAEAKAGEIAERHPDGWVIGADTIVTVDGQMLGKPASPSNARRMLQQLSGRVHQVYTGYCICCRQRGRSHSNVVKTDVQFKALSEAEIDWYIQTGEPFDKAGAYAIQGIGTFLVRRIEGSYTNVVGLPVCEVIEYLIQEKVIGFEGQRS